MTSKNNLYRLLYCLFLTSGIVSCGEKDVDPDQQFDAPTISLSRSTVEGPTELESLIEVVWTAPAGVAMITVNNSQAEVPSAFDGVSGSFSSAITIGMVETMITYTITDLQQKQSTATVSVTPDIDEVGITLTFPLLFETTTFQDTELVPDPEPEPFAYDFLDPVCSDALDDLNYIPDAFQNYVRDYFAMRTLRDCTDMHQGVDIVHEVNCSGQPFDDDNPPAVNCMCDGVVDRIDAENKCSVYILCDQGFGNASMGENVEIVSRHLDSFADGLTEGQRISKGDPIGVMGTCEANLRHLHLSIVRDNPHENVSGARVFDPTRGGILKQLGSGAHDIRVLRCSEDTTIIRFAVPGNEWGFVQAGVMTSKLGNLVYNSEFVGATSDGSEERDDPYFVDGIGFFAYPFNGEAEACDIYNSEKDDLCRTIPGSTQRGEGNYYPIECEGVYSGVTAVYDLVLLNFGCEDLEKELIENTFIPYAQDVWGYGFKVDGLVQ